MLQGEPDNSDNYLQQHYSLQMNSGSCKRAQNSIIKASFTPNIISVLTESWSFVIVKNSSVCEELFIQDFVWSGSILLILLQMFKVRLCVNCYYVTIFNLPLTPLPGVGDVSGEREEWLPLPGVLHRAGPHPHLPLPLHHLPSHLPQVRKYFTIFFWS